MKYVPIAIASAILLAPPVFAQAAPPAQPLPLPPHTSDPTKLPLIYAVSVRVSDMARAVRFYREGMGATKATQLTPRETSVSFPSGLSINLAVPAAGTAAPNADGAVGFIFQTADIDALVKNAAAAGGTLVRPPSDGKTTGGVRVAFVRDPDGARIEVIQFPK